MDFLEELKVIKSIDVIKDYWALIRCRPDLGTLELRVMDMPGSIEDVFKIAALYQTLVAYLLESDYKISEIYPNPKSDLHLNVNLQKAAVHGLDTDLLNFPFYDQKLPAPEAINKLIDVLIPNAKKLGTEEELRGIYGIINYGTGADKQLAQYKKTKSLKKVVSDAIMRTKIIS